MPNWCENEIVIYPNEDMNACSIMGKLNKCITTEGEIDFNQVIRMPHELLIEENNMVVDEEDLFDIQQRVDPKGTTTLPRGTEYSVLEDMDMINSMFPTKNYLRHRCKYETSYDWRIHNWDTKWNGSDLSFLEVSNERVSFYFSTAWYPPEAIIERWREWFSGNRLKQYAYEPGNNICAMQDDDYYLILDLESDVFTIEEYKLYNYLDQDASEEYWEFDHTYGKYYKIG